MTYGAVIKRYLLAGLVSGILCALYLRILGEPVIRAGLDFEDSLPSEGPADPELFTRDQQVLGGMVALVFVSLLLSFLFGTLYAFLRHRIINGQGDVRASTTLAALAFLLTVVVPWIRYPFLPPGMGNGETVWKRSFWELLLIVTGIVAFVLIQFGIARLKGRISEDVRWILAIVVPVVVIGLIMFIFPSVSDPYPDGIPAQLIWSFRIRSLGSYALFWAIIGIFGGWLVSRAAATSSPGSPPSIPQKDPVPQG
ncbi:CbtA family protein [Mycolicibacterium sphagni]|uniref:CbtA family protein n=1 Tax=Mycolicibacterium sphagni TaxID=1786 RepID=UPI0021F2D8A6|nr:CbtA family protein [Mycolicibacterium sphagni]MCV7174624.1 CbtA family protein [Mycolicibacterium sphagni]